MPDAYITMDLVIAGRFNLTDLVAALEMEGLSPGLPIHASGGVSSTRLGVGWYRGASTPDKDVKKAIAAIDNLSDDRKSDWNRLHRREFDFGFETDEAGLSFTRLSSQSLEAIVKAGGSIGFSVYRDLETHFTTSDVDAALEDARRFALAGDFESALERRVWYHENALKYHSAHTGVRLSFALADWAELALKYPPADLALRDALQNARANMRRDPDNHEFSSEAMSLAMYLKDYASAREVFYEMGGDPHYQLISELDEILETGDLAWLSDILGDPLTQLRQLVKFRNLNLLMGHDPDLQLVTDEMLARKLSSIIACLTACDRANEAEEFRVEAINGIDSELVQNALKLPEAGA